jgi:tetratricopeptide (TPR) repeat protein
MRNITDGYQYDPKGKDYNWANMYKQNDLLKSPWLGYKIQYKDDYYEEYNNLLTTRDVNRLAFLDESISKKAINVYLSKIEFTNLLIDRKNKETVFADDVQETVSEYTKEDVLVSKEIEEGNYDEALAEYQSILEKNPYNADAYYGIGLVYEKMGDMVRARAEWRNALKVQVNHPGAIKKLS